MNIFKKIEEIRAGFGNIKVMQRLHIDTFTENKIKEVKGVKIAEGKSGQLFIDLQELAGYEFLNLNVIADFAIKTGKGAQLVLQFHDGSNLIIKSDTLEIESEFSNVSDRYLTPIDFVMEDKEKQQLLSTDLKAITLLFKNRKLSTDLNMIKLNTKEQQILFPTIYNHS
jgi:hypothetical protein